jgi:Zn/Cd-binding protein ZinT
MKKRHDSLLHGVCVANSEAKSRRLLAGFAVLLITAMFTWAGCDSNGSNENTDPELAKWNGTWNSFANYVDEPWLNDFFTQGAAAISSSTGQSVSADTIKGLAKTVFATPFKSFKIQDDSITFYQQPDAAGTGVTISYAYVKKEHDEGDDWYYFEGSQSSDYKYWIALPSAQDSDQTPVHFHFHYAADGFPSAVAKIGGMSQTVAVKQGTTNDQVIAQFTVLLQEIDWADIFASLQPSLSAWAGTWNSMVQYLDDEGLDDAWASGAVYVNESLSRDNVTADDLKGVFATMLRTDFESCVIDGDTMKIYTDLNAGSPSDTITYTYKGTIGEGEEMWYSFEGNKAGDYKYLIALAVEPGSETAAEHFHFRYGASSFDALTADEMGMWMATVMKQGTTISALAASLEEVIEALPWQYILSE